MKKVNFSMGARALIDGDPCWDEIEMAIIEKVEAMMRAVREGGMELGDCMEIYEPYDVTYLCPHCGRPLIPSGLGQYDLLCPDCDEDFFAYECKKEE